MSSFLGLWSPDLMNIWSKHTKNIYKYLTAKRHKPTLNVINNKASKEVKKILKHKRYNGSWSNQTTTVSMPPKHTIQLYKNHFLAGLATVDPIFPL